MDALDNAEMICDRDVLSANRERPTLHASPCPERHPRISPPTSSKLRFSRAISKIEHSDNAMERVLISRSHSARAHLHIPTSSSLDVCTKLLHYDSFTPKKCENLNETHGLHPTGARRENTQASTMIKHGISQFFVKMRFAFVFQ